MQANAVSGGATDQAVNDIGPLAWVLDELKKSLDAATKAIRRFVRDAEMARGSDLESVDASQLRIARQQLHQAVGALEMVGLEGAAKVLRGMEALAKKFVEHPELCSEDAAEKVEKASFALMDFLQGVMRGKTGSSVALFPQYRAVLELVGEERIHPADLWTPEWRWIDVALPVQAAALSYEPAVRTRMDPAVLKIVKEGNAAAAKTLSEICLGLAAGAQTLESRVFWKISAAYFEAMSLGLCPTDVYAKRAGSRVLMQYSTLARGDQTVSDRLAQDLLFFCAQSVPQDGVSAPVLNAIRDGYGLNDFPAVDYELAQYGRFDPAVLAQARKRIATATETWSALSGGDTARLKVVSDQFSAVSESILKLHPESMELARAFTKAVESTVRSGEPPRAAVAMEVATAILYLDATYEDLDPASGQMMQRSQRLAQRLEHVMAGGQPEPLEDWMEELYRRVSDRQTMGSVVEELRTALGEIEKSLDQFFRNPEDKQPLQDVPQQLGQMRGVLSVLGLDQASLATLRMRDMVEKFMVDGLDADARAVAFEKFGNSLGALGFLVDMLSYQRTLAKKLFVYDESLGEFKPLMGRTTEAAKPVPAKPQAAAKPEQVAAATAVESVKLPEVPAATPSAGRQEPAKPAAPVKPAAVAPIEVDQDDDAEVREIFLEEAREVVVNGLVAFDALAADPADLEQQTTVRRAFHTLKGSSRMVGLTEFGEAAWAMEQLFNSWLAEQKPVSESLQSLAREAMQGFGHWVEDIAAGTDQKWSAAPFRKAADAMRMEGKDIGLTLPVASEQQSAPAEEEADFQPTQMFELEDEDFAAPEQNAPQATGMSDGAFEIDFSSLSSLGDEAKAEQAAPVSAEQAPPAFELQDFSLALEPDESTAQAQEEPPSAVFAPSSEVGEIPVINFELPSEIEKTASVEATPRMHDSQEVAPVLELPEFDLPELDIASDTAPEPEEAELQVDADAETEFGGLGMTRASIDGGSDEQVKVIGDLRIGIPLYNVFLNEADEWSRRLQTELGEWALELHKPISDNTIGWAHSLGGSSATVGFNALSELARLLEQALRHVQLQAQGLPGQAEVFVTATEEIRHLLHQFAAGFLIDAKTDVLGALRNLLNEEFNGRHEPEPESEQVSAESPAFEFELELPEVLETPEAPVSIDVPEVLELPEVPAVVERTLPRVSRVELPKEDVASERQEDADLSLDFSSMSPAPVNPEPAPSQEESWAGAAQIVLDDQDDEIDAVDVLDPDLFPIFEEEALELMPQLGGALRQWSEQSGNQAHRAEVLRVLHTLKGSARLAGAMRLGEMAHRMESAIEQMGSEAVQPAQIEPMLSRFDGLQHTFDGLRAGGEPEQPVGAEPVSAQVVATPVEQALSAAGLTPSRPRPTVLAAPRQGAAQTVRVRSQLLDRLLNQAGEVMITRSKLDSNLGQLRGSLDELTGNLDRLRTHLRDIELHAEMQMQSRMAQAKETAQGFDPLEFDRFTRVQELTRMMAESVNDVATVQRNLQRTMEGTEDALIAQGHQTRELQRELLRTRMVEFEAISERLYGVVRQAAKDAGKQVKLDIRGGTLEMDRGVLERMAPAFEHMLRNSVAHGIERATVREAAGKPAAGTITIDLQHDGNDVSITFGDDGAGLNLTRIRDKARAAGLIPAGAMLSDADAANLIFMPGFSTATEVSELAGRGIGMDVVRSELNALGGRVETSTEAGRGTRFNVVLPLTTAVTQVTMLRMGELIIGVPANLVEIVKRTSAQELDQAYRAGRFSYGGEELVFYWSGALLQFSAASQEVQGKNHPVVILRSAGQRLAIHVDEVLGNQEVVVKNLGPQLSQLPGLAAMSVLASGAVVLIYNPVALATVYGNKASDFQRVQKGPDAAGAASTGGKARGEVGGAKGVPLVLVVDDSITVRRVTQRLLKREGYRVALAADGLQALERLQEERPAVVLSDIEMPRMDGFDLARNIRADESMRDLPIIMITSRIAEKHREHARELGVDHYLGKPYSEEELLVLVKHYCDLTETTA